MSHELRTPLNSLLILAGELKDNGEENLTEAQVQYASVIHSSGSDLLRLLNDILDLAKVESGTVHLDVRDLLLEELREAIDLDFRHVAEQKGLGFSVDLDPAAPASIATDAGRLRQVLKNLLSNAFKFTDRGEVTVTIGPAGERVAVSVTDSGIGITSDLQQRIFEAFAQADGSAARQYGGTGLGLSISRELVHLLGGEITLTSAPEEGSTFTVYLPLATAPVVDVADIIESLAEEVTEAPAELPARVEAPPVTALAGMKVLVVDDDIRNIFAMTTLLERGKLEVISAESGEEALALLGRTPDTEIVLVDIMMPVMDGYATMRAMRKLPGCEHLPIIAVTAKVGPGERQRCMEAGATAYVPKPVQNGPDFLATLVESLPAPHSERSLGVLR
jgi:CheY-like chemotaxis protein/two-component sensor histidine kinase